jgi:hypothetical protein
MSSRWLGLGFVAFLAACAASKTATFSKGTSSSAGGAEAGSGGNGGSAMSSTGTDLTVGSGDVGGFSPSSTNSTGSGSADCSEAAKLVYVVGKNNELYSFSPASLQFTPIGIIDCTGQGAFGQPFSMAVDRNGTAWVLFDDSQIFAVSVTDASCKKTAYIPSLNFDFSLFGMGFASDDAMGSSETLYVASYSGYGLAKIALPSMTLTPIGPYKNGGGSAELTGTGDGRLFGFFTTSPVSVAELDKKTSTILSSAPQPSVNIGGGWAFAFWGGDFWLFTAPNGVTSQVDRYSPSKQTTTTVAQVNFKIVGAGVSTCAPVEQPK